MSEIPPDFETERRAVLDAALARAPFEGWTPVMLRRAASDAGVSASAFAAALPGGVAEILDYWSLRNDETMTARLSGADVAAMKIREKVAFAVRERLAAMRPHKEAARRAAATLALPPFAPTGAKVAWRTCDAIWRGIGDRSTDFNYYTKRATLFAVWTSTFARWLADDSADEAPTEDFLARRIANVMQIEKAKAEARKIGIDPEGMFGWLAKLRYPAR